MKANLILIGGGGHAKSCIDVIEQQGRFSIKGILDPAQPIGTRILNYEVIGTDENISDWLSNNYWFAVTVGQVKNAVPRKRIFDVLKGYNANIATVISPLAYVSPHARIGTGTFVMHGAKVNAAAQVGNNCIINTNANIEHDVIIGNHSHVSTGAMVNGGCRIGDNVFVGSGVVVKHGIIINDDVIIGSGAAVYKNINEQGIYVGNPIKRID
jgi:sugar O-acyltransferase (sialic acid O-acetyltransferase NeuD family)